MSRQVTELARQVRDHWQRHDVPYRAGVTPAEITAFEHRWGVVLPDEVRAFYSVVAPEPNWQTLDGELLTFHALQELEHFPTGWGIAPGHPECAFWFVAVDYFLRAWMLAFELTPWRRETCRVIFINSDYVVAFESLAELLEAYLRNPEEVAFPRRVWPAG